MLLVYMYVLKHSFRWDDFENYASSIIMQFDNDNNNIKCLQETERMDCSDFCENYQGKQRVHFVTKTPYNDPQGLRAEVHD